MQQYRAQDRVQRAYNANVKRLRLEGRIVLDEVMNEVLDEFNTRFNERLARGELLVVGGGEEELRALFAAAAQRRLGSA